MKCKLLVVVLLLFAQLATAQTWPIHREAESYDSAYNIRLHACVEGGNAIRPTTSTASLMYRVFVPKDGNYHIRVRMSGPGGIVEVKDSLNAPIGDIQFSGTSSPSIYGEARGTVRLRAGLRKLRISAKTDIWSLNWIRIDSSIYRLYNNFYPIAPFATTAPWRNTMDSIIWEREIVRPDQIRMVWSPSYNGKPSIEFNLHKADSPAVRAEVRQTTQPGEPDEMWASWYEYLPAAYWSASDAHNSIIGQWHEIPDWHLGENWRSPPILKKIVNNRYYVNIMWDNDPDSVNTNESKDGEVTIDCGPILTNQWVKWVFKIKFSPTNTGILQIWKNGELVVDRVGMPNCFADKFYPYFKIGFYGNAWCCAPWRATIPVTERKAYIAELKLGKPGATYADM
jgi:hypothetical protein